MRRSVSAHGKCFLLLACLKEMLVGDIFNLGVFAANTFTKIAGVAA